MIASTVMSSSMFERISERGTELGGDEAILRATKKTTEMKKNEKNSKISSQFVVPSEGHFGGDEANSTTTTTT